MLVYHSDDLPLPQLLLSNPEGRKPLLLSLSWEEIGRAMSEDMVDSCPLLHKSLEPMVVWKHGHALLGSFRFAPAL